MKKNLLFFATLLLIVSCSKFEEPTIVPLTADDVLAEETVSEYAVSVDDALAALDIALKSIDGADTRSTDARRVRSVKALKARDVLSATRTEQIPDVEDMFYIVSFDEGEGSAVLGADTRLEGIYAILDDTELSPADFVAIATRSDAGDGEMRYVATEEELRQFVTSCITSAAVEDLENAGTNSFIIDPPIHILPPVGFPIYDTVYVGVYRQAPLCSTKWDQGTPYNNLCPLTTNSTIEHQPAGCVAIALAQILSANQDSETISISGNTFYWHLINQCNYGCYPTDEGEYEVARFIRAIGDYVDMYYGDNGSSADDTDAKQLLNHIGYESLSIYPMDDDDVNFYRGQLMVCDRQIPYYASGARTGNIGHAWVIDGWDAYRTDIYVTYEYSGMIPIEPAEPELYSSTRTRRVHCNMGWEGLCDGYYAYRVFNTSVRLDDKYIDTSIGDEGGTMAPSAYNIGMQYIFYKLSDE